MTTNKIIVFLVIDEKELEIGYIHRETMSIVRLLEIFQGAWVILTDGLNILVEMDIYVHQPWSQTRILMSNDLELLKAIDAIERRDLQRMVFEINPKPEHGRMLGNLFDRNQTTNGDMVTKC